MRIWVGTLVLLMSCGAVVSGWDGTPTMRPGEDCLACHSAGGSASARRFTAAGTVFGDVHANHDEGVANANVVITDSAGNTLTLRTNGAGNFYTAEALHFPIQVQVENSQTMKMVDRPASGSCNSCHTVPAEKAPGRLFVP